MCIHFSVNVENEAVLMAINEHGLQQAPEENINYCNQPPRNEQPVDFGASTSSSSHMEVNPEPYEIDFLDAAVGVAIQKKGLAPTR